ncbi:DNA cytosine methyltransferase [Brevibacillus borstelensis]|uniref:DNA cytosine methyltransferase n=1 Tax=Brevibacillus borstelensis TaxID=45462 RepID=UPI002E21689F|nr:DNA cytosine methyltransferase [Brevibacillus borstelensis]
MSRIIRNISLFAGCGGIDLGFKWAGINTVAAVEIKEYACATLRRNFPETYVFGPPYHTGDVRNITGDEIRQAIQFNGEIDVLSGGPPCQPFSVASGQRWGKDDPRYRRKGNENKEIGDLLPDYVRLIQELKPKVFLLENVEGLLTWNEGEYLMTSLQPILNEYKISKPQVINAVNYGVPQYRERFILIGTRIPGKIPSIPEQTHAEADLLYEPYTTVENAFESFSEDLPNHELREHKPETIERYRRLAFGQRDKLGRVDRLNPFLPSKTVISGGDRGGGRSHLHPYLPRTLSPRECARLQTFPDDFIFEGNMSRQFTQVGNAVPPLLAYHLGRYIVEEILEERTVPGVDLSEVKHPVVSKIALKKEKAITY